MDERDQGTLDAEHALALLDGAADPIFVLDDEGRFLHVNERALRVYGYSREEFARMRVTDLDAGTTQKQRAAFTQLVATGEVQVLDLHHRTKDGTLLRMSPHARRVRVGDREVLVSVVRRLDDAQSRDVELERMARAAEENAVYRQVVLEAFDCIALARRGGGLAEVNPAFVRTFGWTREDLDADVTRMLPAEEFARIGAAVEKSREFAGEVKVRRKDGVERVAHVNISLLSGESTGLVAVAILRDVTDERARREQDARLVRLESLGALAGGVAHDFNNLLAAQMSMLGVLKRHLEAPLRDDVTALEEVTMRAASLARQLLLFARGGTRRREPVDAGDLTREVARLCARTFGAAISIETRVGEGIPLLLGDAGGLVQVLLNFAINARDAMPAGGTLTLEADRALVTTPRPDALPPLPAGEYVRLAVSDDGVGMDDETRARLFEPFFTTKATRGSGLGMSVAYGVVRDHGGSLIVRSEPSRGTCIEVYLPAKGP